MAPDTSLRRRRWALGAVGALILVLAGVVTIQVLRVRSDLQRARSAATALRADLRSADVTAIDRDLTRLQKSADAAVGSSHGLVWRATSHVPLLGRQLSTARNLSVVVQSLAKQTLAPAATALRDLQAKPPIAAGQVDLPRLTSLAGTVDQAITGLSRAHDQLMALPHSRLLGALSDARTTLLKETSNLDHELVPLRRALRLAPGMLGEGGPRTYMVVSQNPAEARATGGFIGNYSIVRITAGRLQILASSTDHDLIHGLSAREVYDGLIGGERAGQTFLDSVYGANTVPDWPTAAGHLARIWKDRTGVQLDGVIGLNPGAIATVLRATGPVHLSDGLVLDGGSVVRFIEQGQFTRFRSDDAERRAVSSELSSKVTAKVLTSHLDLSQLRSLSASVARGEVTVASTHPEEQAVLDVTQIGGVLPRTSGLIEVVDNNITGGKLGIYLERAVHISRKGSVATVSMKLTNAAPAPAVLTKTQLSRLDGPPVGTLPGSVRELITLYAGPGTRIDAAAGHLSGSFDSHPTSSSVVVLAPGGSETLTWTIGGIKGGITYRVQPLARGERASLR